MSPCDAEFLQGRTGTCRVFILDQVHVVQGENTWNDLLLAAEYFGVIADETVHTAHSLVLSILECKVAELLVHGGVEIPAQEM